MNGEIKVIEGIYPVSVDSAIYKTGTNISLDKTLLNMTKEKINLYDLNNPDNFIEVESNTIYYFSGGEMKYFTYYDNNKTQVSTYNSYGGSLTTPINCKFIKIGVGVVGERSTFVFTKYDQFKSTYYANSYERINLEKNNGKVFDLATKGLIGVKINMLGDSITNGAGATTKPGQLLANNLFGVFRNYGINGNALSGLQTNNPMWYRYTQMDDDADIIIVMGGHNDPTNNIGDMTSTSNETFYGALKTLCNGLLTKYPEKFIMFATFPNYEGSNSDSLKKVNAIIDVCGAYGIPVFDQYRFGGFTGNNPSQKAIYYHPDGYHPNDNGNIRIAKNFENFLKMYYRY